MAKIQEKDYQDGNIRFALPVEKFTFQSLSRKAALDVCRFDGTTYLWNPSLKRGKKYEEVYILALVNEEEVVQRLDYSFLAEVRTFLKKQAEAEKSDNLFDYKLQVTVNKIANGEFWKYEYTIEKSKPVTGTDVEAGNTKLLETVNEKEAEYKKNSDEYLLGQAKQPEAKAGAGEKDPTDEWDKGTEKVADEDLPFMKK